MQDRSFIPDQQNKLPAITSRIDSTIDLRRNAKCPCGSGRKIKQCHRELLQAYQNQKATGMQINRLYSAYLKNYEKYCMKYPKDVPLDIPCIPLYVEEMGHEPALGRSGTFEDVTVFTRFKIDYPTIPSHRELTRDEFVKWLVIQYEDNQRKADEGKRSKLLMQGVSATMHAIASIPSSNNHEPRQRPIKPSFE